MFAYLGKTKFQIPQTIIDQVRTLDPISFDQNDSQARNPIYRQLNRLVLSPIQIKKPMELRDPDTGETLEVTPELLDKLRDRYHSIVNTWQTEYTPFKEQELPTELQEQVIACLPKALQDLNPRVAIQSKFEKQGIVPPHRDHYRTASLFFLLEGNGEETRWWTPVEDFEQFSFFRFADARKIKQAYAEVIQSGLWYVFDNYQWHSVHPGTKVGRRTALCIEFDSVSGPELYNLINTHAV